MSVLTCLTNAVGLRQFCEDHLGGFVPEMAWHRTGKITGPLAVMLPAGGGHVSDLDILRNSPDVFGGVASNSTVSRFFNQVATAPEAFSGGFAALTKRLRWRVWDSAAERNPARHVSAHHPLIIDLDATLVTSHSDKDGVTGNYKGGYG